MRPAPFRLSLRTGATLWRRRFLQRLGPELAASVDPVALLLELRPGAPGPVLAGRGAPIRALLERAAAGTDGALVPTGALPTLPASPGLRLCALDPVEPDERSGPRSREALSRPEPDPFAGPALPEGAWAVQVHLAPGPTAATLVASVRLGVDGPSEPATAIEANLVARLAGWLGEAGLHAVPRRPPTLGRARREWRDGSLRRFGSSPAIRLPAGGLAGLARVDEPPAPPAPTEAARHALVVGGSGAGKTEWLAREGAMAIRSGEGLFAIDVHGDLAPKLLARLSEDEAARVIAMDAERGTEQSPGIDILRPAPGVDAAPRIVAAFRRGSDDDGDVYWGFRLERIFDEFVRLTLEERGNLRDLYALLTDERRREGARLATRSEERARFLEEIGAIVRRNPEFLWPAAARLSKLALSEPLLRLLAPVGGGIDLEPELADGRAVVVRLPIGRIGPEAARLAATLLVGHVYLERIGREPGRAPRLWMLLDEAQSVAPGLLTEILTEGRKFGVALRLATQYPGRLEGRLREAAAASAAEQIAMRTPRPAVESVAPWLGLSPAAAELLPELPTGSAVVAAVGASAPGLVPPARGPAPDATDRWSERVAASGVELGAGGAPTGEAGLADALWTLRRSELSGTDPPATELPSPATLDRLAARGYVARDPVGRLHSTPAGLAVLGESVRSGATRESAQHRALIVAAFRLFARRGERLEIVRQGRFDTRLPDARLLLLSPSDRAGPPGRLAERLAERQRSWVFRAFGGRDVHVEAEVSGARRPLRLRRDLEKAAAAGAHCLFLVGEPRDGARVRAYLAEHAGIAPATVWVLRLPPDSGADIRPEG